MTIHFTTSDLKVFKTLLMLCDVILISNYIHGVSNTVELLTRVESLLKS
jgi:hypothetical protein